MATSRSAPDATAPHDLSAGPLRVVIVDDEPLARDCMRIALAQAADVEVVAECGDGVSALEAIREHHPDLVFLDVQMPGVDGFGVIDRIGVHAMPPVVFVTAYDAHAIRAFEVHALDYVLKPFGDRRFLAALERARETVRARRHGELGRRLAALVHEWHAEPRGSEPVDEEPRAAPRGAGSPFVTRFAVRDGGRVRFVAAADVDWMEADGNYLILHVGEARHRIRASLAAVIESLDPGVFARIHRSAIVNLRRIREVQPWFGGDYVAILTTGARVKVSRLRAAQLLRPMA